MSDELDILVIEDELVVQEAADRVLRLEGLGVDRAMDSESAVDMVRRNEYKVILSDLMLPGASGFDIIELINTTRPAAQVIVITGYATLENAVRSFQLGVFDFIPKPFDFGELLGVVRRALRYHDLVLAGSVPSPRQAQPEQELYALGQHTWALLDPEGSATLGVAETFPNQMGEVNSVELPDIDSYTTQGRCFVRIHSADAAVYRVLAPLSGQIMALNFRIREESELLSSDPYGDGWLVRIIPENLEEELCNLTHR
jgi:CheY-like chemotaxis protein/glycine cleavage system H lipoate-binding protein